MTTEPIDGWCQCGYRRSAHIGSRCPQQEAMTFRANVGSDWCEALHERVRAERAVGEQTGLDL